MSHFLRLDGNMSSKQIHSFNIKKNPNISFIMPAYNCELTISESVKSIMDRNFTLEDELIIVNDGSTDGTQDILTNLQKQFPVIKIITHKKNKGGGNARNTAVKNASNEIIFCLDADNVLQTKSIPKLKEYMIKKRADVAAFKELRYFIKNKKVTHKWIFKGKTNLADCLKDRKFPGSSGNYMYTKESWKRAGGYPEFSGALDTWGFGFRQLATDSKMIVMPNSYYYHRYGHNSYWTRESKKNNFSQAALKIFKPYFKLFRKKDVEYITSKKGRYKWFDELEKKHLHLKKSEGEDLINK